MDTLEARLGAREILHDVYCAAVHGLGMQRVHGAVVGNARAAAERYVNHILLPKCEETIFALFAEILGDEPQGESTSSGATSSVDPLYFEPPPAMEGV